MSKPMSFYEFNTLLELIKDNYSPTQMTKMCVKYIDPHIDMRDCTVFSITFRGFGWDKTLTTVNAERDIPESLFDRCLTFLSESNET